MNDLPIREPIQKRSIEKKTKIVKAGLDLFCEKGFYKTNTVEIAKAAGVSTGTVYSYFKNKTDIYIASFEYFLDSYLRPLLEELETLPKPVDTQVLIDKCLNLFINLYVNSKQTVNELGLMQESEPEIMQHFAAYEDMILSALVKAFDNPNVTKKHLTEKMYLLYALSDILGQEHAFNYHGNIDLDVLRCQITAMITHLFVEEL
ncbi:TetR/AcrR family transcriptional regulator [Anaerotruncus rubiinfantis]|uniref:TetR/AcrR family transcriptional regulator n=1 Tax=Anaerotruncus rubiinfantis TaxID=1720200 RepID=UPI00083194AC|nr:TetR/AcrR family transcriptional regulator [Anaerotruncus rubiinfantis]